MRLQKLFDELRLMSREVINNDMNLLSSGLTGNDVGKKRYKLLTRMSRGGLTKDRSCLCIQRCIQRERAMSVIFKPMSLCSSGRHRQHRIQPVQSLNAAFFIYTENCSVLRRIHVKPNDVGCLPLKVWILRYQVALDPVRLKPRSFPYTRYYQIMHPKVFGQFSRAPVRGAVGRRTPRPIQNLGFQARRQFCHCAARMSRVQTADAVLQKALLPTSDEGRVAREFSLDRLIGFSFSQHEYQPCSTNDACRQGPRPGMESKFFLFRGSQFNCLIGHASL